MAELRVAAARLPDAVPWGVPADEISGFSTHPVIPPDTDVWEYIDQQLNRVIGFNQSIPEIAAFLRRGPLGVNGLCDWIQSCLIEFNISEDLLEGKIQRIMDAIELRIQ